MWSRTRPMAPLRPAPCGRPVPTRPAWAGSTALSGAWSPAACWSSTVGSALNRQYRSMTAIVFAYGIGQGFERQAQPRLGPLTPPASRPVTRTPSEGTFSSCAPTYGLRRAPAHPSVENRMWQRSEPDSVPAPHRPEPSQPRPQSPDAPESAPRQHPSSGKDSGRSHRHPLPSPRSRADRPQGAGLWRWRSWRPTTSQTRTTHYESQARNPPAWRVACGARRVTTSGGVPQLLLAADSR